MATVQGLRLGCFRLSKNAGCRAALFMSVGSKPAARCQARQHWRASVDGATQHPVLPRSTPACAPSQVDSLNGIPQCALSTPRKYTALCVPSSRALWRARFRWRSRRCVACAPGNGKSPSHARVVRFRRTAPCVRRHHAQPPLGLALASGFPPAPNNNFRTEETMLFGHARDARPER